LKTKRFVLNRALHQNGNGNKPSGKLPAVVDSEAWRHRKSIIDDVVPEGLPPGKIPFRDPSITGAGKPANPRGQVGVGAAAAPAVVDDPDTDSGDPKLLFDFISWTVDNHEADHYVLILSGHGSGVLDQEFLRDESSKGTLTIQELGEVFAAVKKLKDSKGKEIKIDVLGFDSCVMGMAEVCYELALTDTVKYMVSSESFSPSTGWPYGRIIQRLSDSLKKAAGPTSAEDLARIAIDEHVDFYLDYAEANGLSVDLSLLDVAKIADIVDDVRHLAEVLTAAFKKGEKEFRDQIVLAHWEAQSYNGEVYVDLRDFCDCLQLRYGPPGAKRNSGEPPDSAEIGDRASVFNACTKVINGIDNQLVKESCYMGVTFQYSFGVSIYFPWAEIAPDYNEKELKFIEKSGWRDFLKVYVEETRRKPRGHETAKDGAGVMARNEPATDGPELMALDINIRRTITDQKGPANVLIRSMRNPPINVVVDGLSECTKKRFGIKTETESTSAS
jgi:NTP pyrophosphatase (non-canonical NTP hydrolase)